MNWRPKRFWAEALVQAVDGGFAVRLDGRALRTPAKAELIVPTRALAEEIAAEWQAQEAEVRPETMPMTRTANSAIDKVAAQHRVIAEDLAGYGGSDLLCYRATFPDALIARQAEAWDPLLLWAAELGAPLQQTSGIVHVAQPEASTQTLSSRVHALDPFALAAFHDLVALSGSLVLALAVLDGRLAAEEAWTLSRIDEDWQIEQWGHDEEAAALTRTRHLAFRDAARFLALLHA